MWTTNLHFQSHTCISDLWGTLDLSFPFLHYFFLTHFLSLFPLGTFSYRSIHYLLPSPFFTLSKTVTIPRAGFSLDTTMVGECTLNKKKGINCAEFVFQTHPCPEGAMKYRQQWIRLSGICRLFTRDSEFRKSSNLLSMWSMTGCQLHNTN